VIIFIFPGILALHDKILGSASIPAGIFLLLLGVVIGVAGLDVTITGLIV